MSENLIQKIKIKDIEYDVVDVNAVKIIPQDLTDEQKAQARENIGVVGTGKDGVSPTISLSDFSDSNGSGVRVTVENGDGSFGSHVIYNGENGTSAFASVTKTGNVATIITRDATGNNSVDIYDGSDYVLTDVDKEEIAEIASELVNVPKPRNNVKNVKDYGAVGDGTTDDTDSISAAISDLGYGDTLYFPEGVYRVSNINLKSNMIIQGSGWCSVIQLLDATYDYHGRNNCLNIENVNNIIIRDIKLDGTRSTQQATAPSQDGRLNGIHIRHASEIMIENVWMYNNGYHGCIMTYATNVVFERCKSTDNGFRPIHGHTQIYNCRVSNCLCENNGLGLTGGSGFENDSIFFFGMQHLTISDNIVKSNRRGCITVGSDQDTTDPEDIIPSRNVTISGNVCECYEDLPHVPSTESDTGVAKFPSMGILIYGGNHILENVTVVGNTIKNAHQAIRFYSQENELCSINAVVNGNTIIDCSYGFHIVDVADITIGGNQVLNLAHSLLYAENAERLVFKGNAANAPGISMTGMCRLFSCKEITIQGNQLIGDCEYAVYVPASNFDVIVKDNILSGFTAAKVVLNTNGCTSGNLYTTYDERVPKSDIGPYSNSGFVRNNLINPNTNSQYWRYTTPIEINDTDVLYELNTYVPIPVDSDPTTFDFSNKYTGIVFLTEPELSTAVGIVNLFNGNGTVTFSDTYFGGEINNIWGVNITISSEKVKELFPTAKYVLMQVEIANSDPDNLSNAYHNLNDGHGYVYGEPCTVSETVQDPCFVDLSGYAEVTDIPTKVSELTNDIGYLTTDTETVRSTELTDELKSQIRNNLGITSILPNSTTDNNGQFLRVVNGVATWSAVPNAEEATF